MLQQHYAIWPPAAENKYPKAIPIVKCHALPPYAPGAETNWTLLCKMPF